MPRTRDYRKRPGHRAYISDLWRVLRTFLEPSSRDIPPGETSGLRSDGLSPAQVAELRVILAELGEQFRIGLGGGPLPDAPPDFFAIGAEMPASRFSGSPRLRRHLKPKGGSRKTATRAVRPEQATVDTWILGRAAFTFALGGLTLKEALVVKECMASINATRIQARVAFSRLPLELRRQRGQHDRWLQHPTPDPGALMERYAFYDDGEFIGGGWYANGIGRRIYDDGVLGWSTTTR